MFDIFKKYKSKKYKEMFLQQLPDGLDLIASSLRAGLTFPQAVSVLIEEMPVPISIEFDIILKEHRLGVSLEDSLEKLKERINDFNVDMFVVSTIIAKQTGGNLANILNQIANTIRERYRLKLQVNTLTSQGRLSGIIVSILPFALLAVISVIDSNFVKSLFSTFLGMGILIIAVIMEIIGALLIKKIVSIDV